MRYFLEFVPILLVCVASGILDAQIPSRTSSDEYIMSSSPLPGGGRVISRSSSDSSIQTVTTVADVSVLRVNPQAASPRQIATASNPNATTVYPYPTRYLAQRPLFRQASPIDPPVTYPPFRARADTSSQQPNYKVPTLGITPTARTARNTAVAGYPSPELPTFVQRRIQTTAARVAQNCECPPPTNLRVTGYQVPASDPFSTLAAPTLASQSPTVASQYDPGTLQAQPSIGLQSPNVSVPQYDTTQNQGWTPFAGGANAYQPLIRLTNMKPGTYLGRGIIGQPTAYVDGQPVRNLLRYVFP